MNHIRQCFSIYRHLARVFVVGVFCIAALFTFSAIFVTPGRAESIRFPDIATITSATTYQTTTFNTDARSKTFPVPCGSRVTIAETSGTGCITQFWMTFPGWFHQGWRDDPTSQTILKNLVLRIYWDGSSEPAVESPVGDFFGNGLGEISSFTSRYFGMSSGGFFCKFPMPFRKSFRIEIENYDSVVPTEVFCTVLYQEKDLPENSAWFHAQYRDHGENPGPEPTTILTAEGTGQYVGCVFSGQGRDAGYLYYLESPEFIYIDDDWAVDDWSKARIIGTGLEDYFLGGWYFREGPFTGELHGVTSKDRKNGSIAMYRIHDADRIHFQRRIRFDFINPRNPRRMKPFKSTSVAFFYLNSPHGQNPDLPPADKLIPWYRIKNTDHPPIE